MKSWKQSRLLRNAFVCSIAVLGIGFVGLGVRVCATTGMTHLAFLGLFVTSGVILVSYYIFRRRARNPGARSLFANKPSPANRPHVPRLATTAAKSVSLDHLSPKPSRAGSVVVKAPRDLPIVSS